MAFVKETSEWKLALREKKAELHAVLAARTPDREKALAKQREVSDLRAKLGRSPSSIAWTRGASSRPNSRRSCLSTRGAGCTTGRWPDAPRRPKTRPPRKESGRTVA